MKKKQYVPVYDKMVSSSLTKQVIADRGDQYRERIARTLERQQVMIKLIAHIRQRMDNLQVEIKKTKEDWGVV